jgi:hypothetical protein
MQEDSIVKIVIACIAVALVVGIIAELIFTIYIYSTADDVECNWLWCTFSTERQESEVKRSVTQNCYQNNKEVDCSNITWEIPKIYGVAP